MWSTEERDAVAEERVEPPGLRVAVRLEPGEAGLHDLAFGEGTLADLLEVEQVALVDEVHHRPDHGPEIFKRQVTFFKEFLTAASPTEFQQKDVDFLLSLGEVFALVVYAQLILENVMIYGIDSITVEHIFDFMVRDFSRHALNIFSKPSTTTRQMEYCRRMIEKPLSDPAHTHEFWESQVIALKDVYTFRD